MLRTSGRLSSLVWVSIALKLFFGQEFDANMEIRQLQKTTNFPSGRMGEGSRSAGTEKQ